MKYELITFQILVDQTDSNDVKKELSDWFKSHRIGMDWHNIHSAELNTDTLPSFDTTQSEQKLNEIGAELDLIEFGLNEIRSGTNSIENFTYQILPQLVNNIRSKIN